MASTVGSRRFCNHGGFEYTIVRIVGEGAFGTCYEIRVHPSGERYCLKKICEDPRYKSRELEILKLLKHPNCLSLIHHFVTDSANKSKYLNLVTEFVPETLSAIERQYFTLGQTPPKLFVQLIAYQVLRGVAYLHSRRIIHRDIKPSNILFDPAVGQVKICDFGSAKFVRSGEPSISYITSRAYRAPELILGASYYGGAVDLWSCGAMFAEMLLGQPLFIGDNNAEQFLSICQVLGTPNRNQLAEMNPGMMALELAPLAPLPLRSAFRASTDVRAIDLVAKLCMFSPSERLTGWEALQHPFFDDLRAPTATLPNGASLNHLFEFTEEERGFVSSELLHRLIPPHVRQGAAAAPTPAVPPEE